MSKNSCSVPAHNPSKDHYLLNMVRRTIFDLEFCWTLKVDYGNDTIYLTAQIPLLFRDVRVYACAHLGFEQRVLVICVRALNFFSSAHTYIYQ